MPTPENGSETSSAEDPGTLVIDVVHDPEKPHRQAAMLVKVKKITRGGKETLVKTFPALGGRAGHRTPAGTVSVIDKDPDHRSSIYGRCINLKDNTSRSTGQGQIACKASEKYEGAQMKFYTKIRPTSGFHVGSLQQESHGCIHLSEDHAKWIYENVAKGTPVIVAPMEPKDRKTPKR